MPPSPPPLLPRLRAWVEGRLSGRQTQQLIDALAATPAWFPGTRQTLAKHPGKGIHRLHPLPGAKGGLPTLPVWLSDPSRAGSNAGMALLRHPASSLLAFAMHQRFHVHLVHGRDELHLSYDDLLNLRTLARLHKLSNGEAVEPTPAPDLSALVPALLDHCKRHPEVSRAWLARVSSATDHHAAVMLTSTPHAGVDLSALERALDALMPPGASLSVFGTDGDFDARIAQTLGRLKPLYVRGSRWRWLGLLQRWGWPTKPSVPVIELSIGSDEAPRSPTATATHG